MAWLDLEVRSYFLYWYQGTNSDAEGAAGAVYQSNDSVGADEAQFERQQIPDTARF